MYGTMNIRESLRPNREAAQEITNKKSHIKQHYDITIVKEKRVKRDYLFLHILIAKFHSIKFNDMYVGFTVQGQLLTLKCNNHPQPMDNFLSKKSRRKVQKKKINLYKLPV